MPLVLFHPDDVDAYLTALRRHDRRFWPSIGEEAGERILRVHKIAIGSGAEDVFEGRDVPLAGWLSLLDDDRRRARVTSIEVRPELLHPEEVDELAGLVREAIAIARARRTAPDP